MRPNAEELLRGAQGALLTYVLPHVEDGYARQELMLVLALLNIVSSEWDGAAQGLIDDNATLRSLAERATGATSDDALAAELRALAAERDATARISDLTASNERLRAAITRLAVAVESADEPSLRPLRSDVLALLSDDVEGRSKALLGPRADG